MLTEIGKLVLKNTQIANRFNEYFGTVVQDLVLYFRKHNSELLSNTKSFDRINNIIKKYKNLSNIKYIKKQFQNFDRFYF